MDGVAVVADVVAGLEQQGDGILADRGGAVGRDVADGDTALPGAGDIHDVVARGQHADHFDVGGRPRKTARGSGVLLVSTISASAMRAIVCAGSVRLVRS